MLVDLIDLVLGKFDGWTFGGVFDKMGDQIQSSITMFTADFKQGWAGILDAFKAGDIETVFDLAWKGILY